MEKISWNDRVRNGEVLHRVKEERNIVHTIKRRKANWIGHILRKNCLLKHVIEGKLEGRIEMTGRRGRRRKQLLDDRKENKRFCKLKEEALDRTLWRTRFGRALQTCRKTDCRMNECSHTTKPVHLLYTSLHHGGSIKSRRLYGVSIGLAFTWTVCVSTEIRTG
jgi:hypothetical protein